MKKPSLDDRDMSSKSRTNTQASNDILNPIIEGITLSKSIAISLIDAYSVFVRRTPQMIEQWYNVFWNPQDNTTESKRRVKVLLHIIPS